MSPPPTQPGDGPRCPDDAVGEALFRARWKATSDLRGRAEADLAEAQRKVFQGVAAARSAAEAAARAVDPALAAVELQVTGERPLGEAQRAAADKASGGTLEPALGAYDRTRLTAVAVRKEAQALTACAKRVGGLVPGNVNTLVFVGSLARFAAAEDHAGLDPEGTRHRLSKEQCDDGRGTGTGTGGKQVRSTTCPTAGFFDAIWKACDQGMDIRKLGLDQGVWNVTRIEGTTPHAWAQVSMAASPASLADEPPTAPGTPTHDLKPLPLTPDSAIVIMSAVYDREGTPEDPKLQCRTLQFLRAAQLTGVELTTYGVSGSARNRIDLLTAEQSQGVRDRLASHYYLVLPVRQFMRFSTAQVSEDVLQNGQLVDLAVTRVKTQHERDRLGDLAADVPTVRTVWSLSADRMPPVTIRFPILVSVAQTARPKAGEEVTWTAGTGLAIAYRWPYRSWPGKFLAVEASIQAARRLGESVKRVDGSDAVPATLWGAGVSVNLSGYLGLGVSYMGDIRFTRPGFFLTLEAAPWLSNALGLEKKFGSGGE